MGGEVGAATESTPIVDRIGSVRASQRERSSIGLDPRRNPRATHHPAILDPDPEDTGLRLMVVVPEEVA